MASLLHSMLNDVKLADSCALAVLLGTASAQYSALLSCSAHHQQLTQCHFHQYVHNVPKSDGLQVHRQYQASLALCLYMLLQHA